MKSLAPIHRSFPDSFRTQVARQTAHRISYSQPSQLWPTGSLPNTAQLRKQPSASAASLSTSTPLTASRRQSAASTAPSALQLRSQPRQHIPHSMGLVFSHAIGTARRLLGVVSRESGSRSISAAAVTDAPDGESLWLIVGLGNPGPRYEGTRHNVGFQLIDTIARAEGIAVNKLQEGAAVGRGRLAGQRILLAKPMTFMNVSGESVRKLVNFYKIPLSQLLIVYDDLDLPTAAVRLRAKGGHGGHNGMRSIVQQLGGSNEFPRVRIGIGRPPGQMAVATYVLQTFSKKEQEDVDFAVQDGIDVVKTILAQGMEKALSGVRSG